MVPIQIRFVPNDDPQTFGGHDYCRRMGFVYPSSVPARDQFLAGHARPMLAFLAQLVKVHPVKVTYVMSALVIDRARQELERHFSRDESQRKSLVEFHVVPMSSPVNFDELKHHFTNAYKSILENPSLRHPDVYLCDVIASNTFPVIRELSRRPVSIVAWTSVGPMVNLSQLLAVSKTFDGLSAAVDEEFETVNRWAQEGNTSFMNASIKMFDVLFQEKTIHIPDLPPIAEYELYPQEPPYVLPWHIHMHALRGIAQCEGLVSPSAYCLEPKTFDAFAEYIAPRPMFAAGPLYPSGSDALDPVTKSNELAQATGPQPVDMFMDRMFVEKGPKSVLYISFGSTFSTVLGVDARKLYTWVEVVCEMGIPMVLVYPSKSSPFPEDLRAKVDATGISLVCEYAPQQYMLSHPAMGWFLTHNGLSSTIESLSAGVPMISWPITADQPAYAMLSSLVLNTGYELNEVRNGLGLKRRVSNGVTPTGTLDAVRAEAKEVLRKAFDDPTQKARIDGGTRRIRAMLGSAWDKGDDGAPAGLARASMERFVDCYLR